jgi:exodeoxyribonuclease III
LATWNVNSIRARVHRVIDWLLRNDVDVLAMQETKCRSDRFPVEPFTQAGYRIVAHGTNQWNGVAFATRLPYNHVTIGFADMPGNEVLRARK